MLVDHMKSLFINTSDSIETIESLDAIAFIPYQQKTLVQLEMISKTRVVPEGYENPSSLGNFEKGCYHRVSHMSTCNQSEMTFGIFIPSSYVNDPYQNNPVLLFLGGLTCDDTNFASKAGQRAFEAAERQVSLLVYILVLPRNYQQFFGVTKSRFILSISFLFLLSIGHCNRNARYISKRTWRTQW